jgi:hypothetical protein
MMRAALALILAALPPLLAQAAPSCLPSLLVPGVAPVGKMHPAKNPDRPAMVTAPWSAGFAVLWWCADGTVNEYHGTLSYVTSRWRTPRDLQLAYTANAASMRAAVGASCFGTGTATQSAECYPTLRGGRVCGNTLITDQTERSLCTAVLKQAASEWPR